MSESKPGPETRIDRIATAFDRAWHEDRRPRIEDYLGVADDDVRPLLTELLRIELQHRRRLGESPTAAEYERRFPDYVEVLDAVFLSEGRPNGTPGDLSLTLSHRPGHQSGGDGRTASDHFGSENRSRFRVLRPHAKGGLGAVFVALDVELNREVALKQILDHRVEDRLSRERFLREAEITGRLEHPGIVPVYALGTYADGRPYYAMRFIRGHSLKEAIATYHATPSTEIGVAFRKLLRRFLDVCNAIEYAHSQGILHRDLKPANIVLGTHGETMVVDWGLAKDLGRADSASEHLVITSSGTDDAETRRGAVLGTPAFMSPEQAVGDLEALGPRSDVYALGATFYCLLTGRVPFEGGDIDEILGRVRKGDFAPPRHVNGTIDKALEAICLRAMALKPADRYASSLDLANDLELWLADKPVSACPDPWNLRLARYLRRDAVRVTATAALLAGAVLGVSALLSFQTSRLIAGGDRLREIVSAIQADRNQEDLFELASLVALAAAPEGTSGDDEKARTLKRTIAVQERLVREHPDRAPLQLDLATTYRAAARLARSRLYFPETVDLLDKAVTLEKGTLERLPGSPTLRGRLAADQDALAWVLVTSPRATAREGTRGIELAEEACKQTRRQNAAYLDTLAAAHARAGDFGRAVAAANEAFRIAPLWGRPEIEARSRLYKSGRPYEEHASSISATLHR